MAERYDVIVIGPAPRGSRPPSTPRGRGSRPWSLDEGMPGGQVKTTHKVSNYPGFPEDVKGAELAAAFAKQAERFGASIARAVEITAMDLSGPVKTFVLDEEEEVVAPAVIVATGAKPRELGMPARRSFRGRGLSYCATCDGAYFEGRTSTSSAAATRRSRSRSSSRSSRGASPSSTSSTSSRPSRRAPRRRSREPEDQGPLDHEPRAFHGETGPRARWRSRISKTEERKRLPTDGVFVFVGMVPRTELLKGTCRSTRGLRRDRRGDGDAGCPASTWPATSG